MSEAALIAIDWGSTNRRIFALDGGGAVLATRRDECGVLSTALSDYPAEIAAIRAELGDVPVIAAGMVGSTRGWRDVGYCPAPVGLADLAAAMVEVDDRVRIVPGLSCRDGMDSDVMRGEEVQVLGAVSGQMTPDSGLFCQPGTHNKWVEVDGGRIIGFATAMTGELFAMLRRDSVLSEMLGGEVSSGPPFRRGVERGVGATDLGVALFRVRAACLLGELDPVDAASYASGLLIGADVGTRGDLSGRTVYLLASGELADLYALAIAMAGGSAQTVDGHTAFVHGIARLQEIVPCA